MATIVIKHRDGRTVWTGEAETIREAVLRALAAGADLRGAYLHGADLRDAYLHGAYLGDAYLHGADLRDAVGIDDQPAKSDQPERSPLTREQWQAQKPRTDAERAARFRARHPEVPVIENLDARMLAAIEAPGCGLDMSQWHSCATTHCRAGWAITLAGTKGAELETQYGPARAGRMIYLASNGRVPFFFDTKERALADIRAQAAEPEDRIAYVREP